MMADPKNIDPQPDPTASTNPRPGDRPVAPTNGEPQTGDQAGDQPVAPATDEKPAEKPAAPLSEFDQLKKDIQERTQQLAEANNRKLRALADYENLQKRTAVQVANARFDGVGDFLKKLLPVLDTFDSALRQLGEAKVDKKVMDGIELMSFQLTDLLDKEGLKPIPAKGEKFNPNVHEAMATQSNPDVEDDVVIVEYEKGYTFKERVLRHAKVVINRK